MSNEARRVEHLTRIAGRETNRFSSDDRARIAGAVVEMIAGNENPTYPAAIEAAFRVGCHAIGCSANDLRAAEAAEIRATVEAVAEEAGRYPR